MPQGVLKNALLYFDRIHILDTGHDFRKQVTDRITRFYEDTKILQDAGVLVPFPLDEYVKSLEDSEAGLMFNYFRVLNHVVAAQEQIPSDSIKKYTYFLTKSGLIEGAIDYGSIPTTIWKEAEWEFYKALHEIISEPEYQQVRASIENDLKISLAIKSAFNIRLPALELKSYEDILEAKYQLWDELDACRDEIANIARAIIYSPIPDPSKFSAELSHRIERVLKDIESKIKHAKKKFLRKLAQEALYGGFAISSTMVTGIPLPLLMLLNSMKNIVNDYGELLERKREIQEQNALSLLLSMKQAI